MRTRLADVVEYSLECADGPVVVNNWIGSPLKLRATGRIYCVACGRSMPRYFDGGYCYNCFQTLAECDLCQRKPELCHYDRGTCREPEWGRKNCLIPHKVYLARSSGVKVGITREEPVTTRWMDQGAVEGMVIAEVPDRKTSGHVEVAIAQHIADKTDFRKMLMGEVSPESLEEVFAKVRPAVPRELAVHLLEKRSVTHIRYPQLAAIKKVNTVKLESQPEITGKLMGIKAQYLIFEDFVFSVRGHSGYEVEIEGADGQRETSFLGPQKSLFELMS